MAAAGERRSSGAAGFSWYGVQCQQPPTKKTCDEVKISWPRHACRGHVTDISPTCCRHTQLSTSLGYHEHDIYVDHAFCCEIGSKKRARNIIALDFAGALSPVLAHAGIPISQSNNCSTSAPTPHHDLSTTACHHCPYTTILGHMRFHFAVLLAALAIAPVCAKCIKVSNKRRVVDSTLSVDSADFGGGGGRDEMTTTSADTPGRRGQDRGQGFKAAGPYHKTRPQPRRAHRNRWPASADRDKSNNQLDDDGEERREGAEQRPKAGHPPSISAKLPMTMRGQRRGPCSPLVGRIGYRGNTTPAQIVTPPAIDIGRFSSAYYVVVKYDAQVIGLRRRQGHNARRKDFLLRSEGQTAHYGMR